MTIAFSPAAQINLDNANNTAESIEARVSNLNELINSIETIYGNNQSRMDTTEIDNKIIDLTAGPWKNSTEVEGTERLNTNSVWDFIFTSPIRDTYYNASPEIAAGLPNFIPNYNTGRYDSIFREHIQRLNISGGLKDSINNAVSQLNNLNTVGYQSQLEQAKVMIAAPLIEELEVFRDILIVVSSEINNPQSIIYKPGSPYGPFSTIELAGFEMPLLTGDIINGINSIIALYRTLFNNIDQLVNLPQDILTRVSLTNAGLEQSPTDPNQFNLILPQEKDPWGIRFSYQTSEAGNLFAVGQQVNEFSNNPTGQSIRAENGRVRQQELIASQSLLEEATVNLTKQFYFQLLPAIKTNLPSSGSTDVPGAMPGIQFRIENNIVKHKIPGFAPVYQPIGIDCIKCTLVGMFTGNDGVDLSASYLEDLSAGLLKKGQSLLDLPFADRSNFSLAEGSSKLSQFDPSNNPFTSGGELDYRNNPLIFKDGVDLPIPSSSKSTTSNNVAVLSEDAFRGAQDFYNEIVSQGREVEVELNLRKGTGPLSGGNAGPFRDPGTGNPKFKGLIKRLDLYYVRRDRCWFIIDLEITNSGLIGNECLNLTNIIEESVELFEGVNTSLGLTKEQLDKCFKDPLDIPLKGDESGIAMVIDQATGLSYFYSTITGNLRTDRTYPLSYTETQGFLYRNRFTGKLDNIPSINDIDNSFAILGGFASHRVRVAGLMLRLAALYEPTLTNKENDFASNWIPSSSYNLTWHGTSWKYNKHDGKFYYVYERDGTLVRDAETSVKRARPLKDLLYDREFGFYDLNSVDKIANFILSEYTPLLQIPDNDCTQLLDELNNEDFNRQGTNSNQGIKSTRIDEEQSLNVVPNQIGNGIDPNIINLPPTTLVNPSNQNTNPEDAQANLEELAENVENGALDRLIEQGLNEYIKVLDPNNGSFIGTTLSPSLNNNLRILAREGTLFTEDATEASLSLVTGRTRVIQNATNNSEISISIKYNVNNPFNLVSRGTRLNYELGRSRFGAVVVKAFLNSGSKVYKIDGLRLNYGLATSSTKTQPEKVEPAPINQEPSDNNKPTTASPSTSTLTP